MGKAMFWIVLAGALLPGCVLSGKAVVERSPEVTLPNIKIVDCKQIGLVTSQTCLNVKFDYGSGNDLIEYAGLNEDEPGINSILSGPLFTSDLVELENSRVSVTLLEEGLDAQIMISGSEGTDELFQLRVNLETGEAHADTFPQDGLSHFDDQSMEENRMTDEERMDLLKQFDLDRAMPKYLK